MNFAYFLKIAIPNPEFPMMTFYAKNFENHISGGFVKIWNLILVIIFIIFPQKWKNWNFPEFSLVLNTLRSMMLEVREVYFRWSYLKPEVDSVGLRVTTVVQMNFLEVCTLDQNRGQNGWFEVGMINWFFKVTQGGSSS